MKENKLIAEFMDLDTSDGVYYNHIVKEIDKNNSTISLKKEQYKSELTHFALLKYHTSWSELMPVVEKIEEQHGCDFTASRRRATRTYDANFMDEANNYLVYVEGCKDRQEATYKAVVEFIKQLKSTI